jgi:hypothetical protein
MTEKKKDEWKKYIKRNWIDFVFNGIDCVEFFQAQEQVSIKAGAAQVGGHLLKNEVFGLRMPLEPTLDPRYAQVAAMNADLGDEMLREHQKAYNEFVKVFASVDAMQSRFEGKQATVHKLFTNHFGPSVLAKINHRLLKKEYFEGWHELDDYFCKDSLKKKMHITNMLNEMAFTFTVEMQDFIEVIRVFGKALQKLSRGVAAVDEEQMILHLTSAVQKGEGNFDFELNVIALGQTDFEAAADMLVNKAARPEARFKLGVAAPAEATKTSKKEAEMFGQFQAFMTMSAAGGNNRQKTSEPRDNNAPGDFKNNQPCFKCNQLGHWRGDPECPFTKGSNENASGPQAHNTSKTESYSFKDQQKHWEQKVLELEKERDDALKKLKGVQAHSAFAALEQHPVRRRGRGLIGRRVPGARTSRPGPLEGSRPHGDHQLEVQEQHHAHRTKEGDEPHLLVQSVRSPRESRGGVD